jgi:predicted glycosyl hydrolase (DUF1957 family)
VIYWAPVFHFYQPPTQLPEVVDRICDECYRPLTRLFDENPDARATFNIVGSLTEQLLSRRADDILTGWRRLAERGQIELTGTAMYHAILPLIPADEMRRQITLNQRMNRRVFGELFRPAGFFPPELCFSADMTVPVVETGHRWLLISGVACPGDWPLDYVPTISTEVGDLAVFFRDDLLSNRIAFGDLDIPSFLAFLRNLRGQRARVYVVTAMDAETFGHHLRGWEQKFLEGAFRALTRASPPETSDRDVHNGPEIASVTVSQLLDIFPRQPHAMPSASSWSTSGEELAAGIPYPLWRHPDNPLHQLQWRLADLALDLVRRAEAACDGDASRQFARVARGQMDRALHSCQFWWASRRPMWDPTMIHRGLAIQQEVLLNAARAVMSSSVPAAARVECSYRFIAARELVARILDVLALE